MALTPQEQAELDQLNAMAGSQPPQGGLSPEEQAELDQLNMLAGDGANQLAALPSVGQSNEGRGMLESAIRRLDSYAGAPVRAAIGAAQDGKAMSAIPAAYRQFGADPDAAPSPHDIALRSGLSDSPMLPGDVSFALAKGGGENLAPPDLSDNPTPADFGAVGVSLGADLTNLLPAIGPAKNLVKGAGSALKGTRAAEIAGDIVKGAKNLPRSTAAKAGHALTGSPEADVLTYMRDPEKINSMNARFGGDVSQAADVVRENAQKRIQATRQALNQEVSTALEASKTAPAKGNLSIDPVVARLEARKAKLDPLVRADQAAAARIDDLIEQIKVLGAPEGTGKHAGKTNPYYMHRIKEILQDAAKPSYDAGGNAIFQGGPRAAEAAKDAAAEARLLANKSAPEGYRNANKQLERLHRIEDQLNKNLVRAGKPEASLLAAGSGANSRNRRLLSLLQETTGAPLVQQAEELSAMRTFGNPSWLPSDSTGKAVARQLGASTALSALLGPIGVPLGMVATSPKTLKGAINLGDAFQTVIGRNVARAGKVADATVNPLAEFLQTPAGLSALKTFQVGQPELQFAGEGKKKNNRKPAKKNATRLKALED